MQCSRRIFGLFFSNFSVDGVGNHTEHDGGTYIALRRHRVVEQVVRHDDREHLSGGHDHSEHVRSETLDRVKDGELAGRAADRCDDVVVQGGGVVS